MSRQSKYTSFSIGFKAVTLSGLSTIEDQHLVRIITAMEGVANGLFEDIEVRLTTGFDGKRPTRDSRAPAYRRAKLWPQIGETK